MKMIMIIIMMMLLMMMMNTLLPIIVLAHLLQNINFCNCICAIAVFGGIHMICLPVHGCL